MRLDGWRTIFVIGAFLLALGTAALATGEIVGLITDADRKRLDEYEATRQDALAEARKGRPEDFAVLDEIVERPLMSFEGLDLAGDWKCRTIKAGGIAQLVVYGWFKCRVTDDGSGWKLDKLTGSQRTSGRFFDDSDKRLIYLGSGFIAGDKPETYGSGPETDQVGYAYRTGEREWRIEFPAPRYESKLDIMEFRP